MSTTQLRLEAYLAAEKAILAGQEIRHDGRNLRRADLADVRAQIDKLQAQLAREQAAASGSRGIGGLRVAVADFSGRS